MDFKKVLKRMLVLMLIFVIISILNLTKYLNKVNEKKGVKKGSYSLEYENAKRWKELELKYKFVNLTLLTNPMQRKDRTIIYQCVSTCGGLGDRLRGIIMCYFLSILLNRQLIIDMDKPCSFKGYFEKNKYKWIDGNEYEVKGSFRHIQSIDHNEQLSNEFKNTNFIEKWSDYDNIELSINIDFFYEIFSNKLIENNLILKMFLKEMKIEEANFQTLFNLFFEILFKPTNKIVRRIDHLLEDISLNDLICTHLRFGKNPSNPNDYLFQYNNDITNTFIQFIQQNQFLKNNSLSKLFVTTDSFNETNRILHSFPNQSFTIDGPILHIDLSTNVNCDDGFTKVVADFYLLSECSTLILTNSGFSAYANRRRLNPYRNLFKFHKKTNEFVKCFDYHLISPWEGKQHPDTKLICPIKSDNQSFHFII